jgi:hypothetical protein
MKKTETQTNVIISLLKQGLTINPSMVYRITKQRCKCGCMKLATRIGEIIKLGYYINKIPADKNEYMTYSLNIKKTKKRK